MKTFLKIIAVALALAGYVSAQQGDNPVYYQVSFQLECTIGYASASCNALLVDETGLAQSSYVYRYTPSGTVYNAQGALFTAKLLPNKDYFFMVSTNSQASGQGPAQVTGKVKFGGKTVVLNGIECTTQSFVGPPSSGSSMVYRIRMGAPGSFPLENAPAQIRGGDCSSIVSDKPIWYLGLGQMRNGETAGAIGFRRGDFSGNFFTPAALYYTAPDPSEIEVINVNNMLRQVFSREVLVDINTITSESYKMEVYPRSQVGALSNGVHTLSGSPFAIYTVEKIPAGSGVDLGVKITRAEGGQTWESSLTMYYSTWTHRDWHRVGSTLDAYQTTQFTSATAATISYTGPTADGSGAETPLTYYKTYTDYSGIDINWGKELTNITYGINETVPLTTLYAYHTTLNASEGAFPRLLKSTVAPDGRWTRYEYYSEGSIGFIRRIYRSVYDTDADPATASTANSLYEDWGYNGTYPWLPASKRMYAPGGTQIGETLWSYNVSAGYVNWNLTYTTTKTDKASSGSELVTVTHSYLWNVPDVSLRDRPLTVQYPDGRKIAYAEFKGAWNSETRSFTASASGEDRLTFVFNGQASSSLGAIAHSGWSKDSVTQYFGSTVYLEPGKSVVQERIIDTNGRLVFEGSNVYTSSSGLARISGISRAYFVSGLLQTEYDVMRGVSKTYTWEVNLLKSEISADGVETEHTYDSLLRKTTTILGKNGASATPAKNHYTKYDGAGRIYSSATCSCSTEVTDFIYDSAGRLDSKTEPKPGATGSDPGLTTTYTYSTPRSVTTSMPGGSTRTETRNIAGALLAVTGTSAPSETYTYSYNANGVSVKVTRGGEDATEVETQYDWLGRKAYVISPGYDGDRIKTVTNYSSSTGQVTSIQVLNNTGGARLLPDTLYYYDNAGRLTKQGSDTNSNGNLDDFADRVQLVDSWFEQGSGSAWFSVSTTATRPNSDNNTPLTLSTTRNRLTGFSSSTGTQVADTIVSNASGISSQTMSYVDPTLRKAWNSTVQTGATQANTNVIINGYASKNVSPSGVVTSYEYDSLGRLSAEKTGYGTVSFVTLFTKSYTYYGNTEYVNTVTDQGIPTSFSYSWSTSGRSVTQTDAKSATTVIDYNHFGQQSAVYGTGAQPAVVQYDGLGRRTYLYTWKSGDFASTAPVASNTLGRAATNWEYDAGTGLLIAKTDDQSQNTSFTYTLLGQLLTKTNARNKTATYVYNDGASGRPLTGELNSVTYNDTTPSVSYTYKRFGALSTVSDATGSRTFSYRTSDLRLDTETLDNTFYAGRSMVLTYQANGLSDGQYVQAGGVDDLRTRYIFDPSTGRIQFVTNDDGGYVPTFELTYTPGTNWVQAVTSGVLSPDSSYLSQLGSYQREQYLSSGRYRLGSVVTYKNDGSSTTTRGAYYATYGHSALGDARGYRHTQQVAVSPDGLPHTSTFSYNDLSQLTSASDSVSAFATGYSYDLQGNRLTADLAGLDSQNSTYAASVGYTPNTLNQYASINGTNLGALGIASSTPVYDADGNLQSDGKWTYTYDAENRLIQTVKTDGTLTVQYKYDYIGRRAERRVYEGGITANNKTYRYIYKGWQLLVELTFWNGDIGTLFQRGFVWGPDFSNAAGAAGGAGGLLATLDSTNGGGGYYLPVYDTYGNVTGYLDGDGDPVAYASYDAYGRLIRSNGGDSFPLGWATQYTDAETGLVYYGMRYYDPLHGRFVNRDPIEEEGGLNLYAFVGNNPTNAWDILGLETESERLERENAERRAKQAQEEAERAARERQRSIAADLDDFWDLTQPMDLVSVNTPRLPGTTSYDPAFYANLPYQPPRDTTGSTPSIGLASGSGLPIAPNKATAWKPNKEDCSALNQRFGEYIHATPNTSFRSPDDAAIGAAFFATSLTARDGFEYGGYIYSQQKYGVFGDTSYYFSSPRSDGIKTAVYPRTAGTSFDAAIRTRTIVADYHTHPTRVEIAGGVITLIPDYNRFSDNDKAWSLAAGIPLFMFNDTGTMASFQAGAGSYPSRTKAGYVNGWHDAGKDKYSTPLGAPLKGDYNRIRECQKAGFIR